MIGKIPALRRATAADILFIMATERGDGYDELVGRWDEGQHAAALADPRYAYFIGCSGTQPVGFAILRDWASANHVTLVQRVAVAQPGMGHGKAMMRSIVDRAFTESDVYRLWIACLTDNVRAKRTYEAVGFIAEGIARGSWVLKGVRRDELVLAILRPDWEAQQEDRSTEHLTSRLVTASASRIV